MSRDNPFPPSRHRQSKDDDGGADYRFGKNSVEALLTEAPERIFKMMVARELSGERRLSALIEQAQHAGVSVQFVPKAKLDALALNHTPHQGVVAMVAPKPLLDVHDLVAKLHTLPASDPPLVVALDGVTDPHNFGAVIRVAAAAGAHGLIVPKVGSAGFSPVVAKASAGTLERMDVVVVPNLVEAMKRLKDAGLWWVGAAVSPQAVRYDTYNYTGPTGIVMGGEGRGLRRLVQATCDQEVHIPMASGVESLNVSVATGILLFEARRQRHAKGL